MTSGSAPGSAPGADAGEAGEGAGPPLPLGRRVELARRGTTFVRDVPGPPGAPTVLLLHGWMASGGLNWFRAFGPLTAHFRVVAPDLRGHARGLRSRRRFTLAACADDTAATLVELGTGPVIAVGYSMGGPVAQLLWRRHMDLVDGLVLVATSAGFLPGGRERYVFQAMMAAAAGTSRLGGLAGRLPVPSFDPRAAAVGTSSRPSSMQAWAAAEFRRHDWRHILEAGHAIGTYHARRWIGTVDVPTTVVVTTEDRAVPPPLQRALAAAIPGARVQELAGSHIACALAGFGEHLVTACRGVTDRARPG